MNLFLFIVVLACVSNGLCAREKRWLFGSGSKVKEEEAHEKTTEKGSTTHTTEQEETESTTKWATTTSRKQNTEKSEYNGEFDQGLKSHGPKYLPQHSAGVHKVDFNRHDGGQELIELLDPKVLPTFSKDVQKILKDFNQHHDISQQGQDLAKTQDPDSHKGSSTDIEKQDLDKHHDISQEGQDLTKPEDSDSQKEYATDVQEVEHNHHDISLQGQNLTKPNHPNSDKGFATDVEKQDPDKHHDNQPIHGTSKYEMENTPRNSWNVKCDDTRQKITIQTCVNYKACLSVAEKDFCHIFVGRDEHGQQIYICISNGHNKVTPDRRVQGIESHQDSCGSEEFRCATGKCIKLHEKCDGNYNCLDYSDEVNCDTDKRISIKVYPNQEILQEGAHFVVRCRDEGTNYRQDKPNVQWLIHNPLRNLKIRNGRITITNAVVENSGEYICHSIKEPDYRSYFKLHVQPAHERKTVPYSSVPQFIPKPVEMPKEGLVPITLPHVTDKLGPQTPSFGSSVKPSFRRRHFKLYESAKQNYSLNLEYLREKGLFVWFGKSSFMELEFYNFYAAFLIEIILKPDSQYGLILHGKGRDDFLRLYLKNGYLEVSFNLGGGALSLTSVKRLPAGIYSKIIVFRVKKFGSLWIENQPEVNGTLTGPFGELNLDTPLFLGSEPYQENGFTGCILEIKINGKKVDPVPKRQENTLMCVACERCLTGLVPSN